MPRKDRANLVRRKHVLFPAKTALDFNASLVTQDPICFFPTKCHDHTGDLLWAAPARETDRAVFANRKREIAERHPEHLVGRRATRDHLGDRR